MSSATIQENIKKTIVLSCRNFLQGDSYLIFNIFRNFQIINFWSYRFVKEQYCLTHPKYLFISSVSEAELEYKSAEIEKMIGTKVNTSYVAGINSFPDFEELIKVG